MAACYRALKPTGSLWVAIGDDYAAEVRLIGRKLDLHLRNWVVWHYTFGQNTKKKFARSHTHLFYWVKDPKNFTFNDRAIRIPSARQTTYADKRANPIGKLPDDVWTEFPRVCGTFQEREKWHPCQMPETILARIIRACTEKGGLVLDPFAGSGTTVVVAKKLSRQYVGLEISEEYVARIKARLKGTIPVATIQGQRSGRWPAEHIQELRGMYLEAGVPTERMFKNPDLLRSFVQKFTWRLEESGSVDTYGTAEVWDQLERLRKQGKLGKLRIHHMERPGAKARAMPGLLERGR